MGSVGNYKPVSYILAAICIHYHYACSPCKDNFTRSFPSGPTSLAQLFGWHRYNADVLLANETCADNFQKLLMTSKTIVIHEDFAGMGTCGASFVQQLHAMKNKLCQLRPDVRFWSGRGLYFSCLSYVFVL